MNQARATSYATYQDLVNYIKCLQKGNSSDYCYNYGDNGVGASGKTTAQIHTPMVALNVHEIQAKWGKTEWGHKVRVVLTEGHGNPIECEVADLGPSGVIDLNPSALIAAGLPEDKELSCAAQWEWIN